MKTKHNSEGGNKTPALLDFDLTVDDIISLVKGKGGSAVTIALTKKQFDFIIDEFKDRKDYRMEILCLLLGRTIRIGDVLKTLTIGKVYTQKGIVRETILFNDEKTGKRNRIRTEKSPRLVSVLTKHYQTLANLPRTDPLFYALKTGKPITDRGVGKLLEKFVGRRDIEQCSPHSFRKFGGRYMWENGMEIEIVSKVMNHHSVAQTRTYLDIKPKEVEKAMGMLEL